MLPSFEEIKWCFGISKADKFYYTARGKEQLEIMWSEHKAKQKQLKEAGERLRQWANPALPNPYKAFKTESL